MTKEEFRSKAIDKDKYSLLGKMDNPALRDRVLQNGMEAQKIISHMDDARSVAGVNAAVKYGQGQASIYELWLAYEQAAMAVFAKHSNKSYAVAYAASMASYVEGDGRYCDGSYCKWD